MTRTAALASTAALAAALILATLIGLASTAWADVAPLLSTQWGQSGLYQNNTPKTAAGDATYPGCTTIATAQVLYYYQYQDHATGELGYVLDQADSGPMSHPDIEDGYLYIDFADHSVDFSAMAPKLTSSTPSAAVNATAQFIYEVGATLNAQFGGGEGASATGKQIENAFRYRWGFNNISRRKMSVIAKSAFGFSDTEWAALMRDELNAGRPVLYMAQQVDANAGHAFVIDGYRITPSGATEVHVNWGWGGYGNGYYNPNTLTDPSGRSWSRDAMVFRGLEPEAGYAAAMVANTAPPTSTATYAWHGTGSIIGYSTGTKTGYGLTQDEAMIHPAGSVASAGKPVVFFQWEVDTNDGKHLRIDAEGQSHASITVGQWNDRAKDVRFANVSLPFVLDPAAANLPGGSGQYFVIAVAFDDHPSAPSVVSAVATNDAASSHPGQSAAPILVDGRTWHGNGSIIANTSGTLTGYGMTRDESAIHASTASTAPGANGEGSSGLPAPAVFFQWEIDTADGKKLQLSAGSASTATLTVGPWNDRSKDVTQTVSLPYTLNPAALGLSSADGTYLVMKLAFDTSSLSAPVEAIVVK